MGDDAAGPLLAQMLTDSPLNGWQVLDGGGAPENAIYKIRELAPDEVLIVDAADMQLQPGEIRVIDRDAIGSLYLMTTHSLPLSYLMEALAEFVPSVRLVGIQPAVVAFGQPVSPAVMEAVGQVYFAIQEPTFGSRISVLGAQPAVTSER
jgi:hydrogenase 3 maturation protease